MLQSIYCNGLWSPWRKVASDLGLWRADGALEVLEARGDILFHWEDHYERLLRSLAGYKEIALDMLPPKEEILAHTEALYIRPKTGAVFHNDLPNEIRYRPALPILPKRRQLSKVRDRLPLCAKDSKARYNRWIVTSDLLTKRYSAENIALIYGRVKFTVFLKIYSRSPYPENC